MSLLSQTLIIIGALTGAGGLLVYDDGSLRAALFVTAVFTGTAILARSSLMAALSVVSLAGCMGARTGYKDEYGRCPMMPADRPTAGSRPT